MTTPDPRRPKPVRSTPRERQAEPKAVPKTEWIEGLSGEAIKAWREGKGLSQTKLARQLDTTATSLSSWENGRAPWRRTQEQIKALIEGVVDRDLKPANVLLEGGADRDVKPAKTIESQTPAAAPAGSCSASAASSPKSSAAPAPAPSAPTPAAIAPAELVASPWHRLAVTALDAGADLLGKGALFLARAAQGLDRHRGGAA